MPTVSYSAFSFCGGINLGLSPVTASQRTINSYPEKNTGVNPKTPSSLIARPGLDTFTTLANGPLRGLFTNIGQLYAVGGDHFYQLDPGTGAVIVDFGAIPGATTNVAYQCQIVSNGVQVLVQDTSVSKIFYANPAGPSMDYVHDGISLEFMNGFFYALTPGTVGVSPSTLYQSDFQDGTTWPPLDFVDISATADVKTRLVVVNNELWTFGAVNIEVWGNAGTSGFILGLNAVINQGFYGGTSGGNAVARAGNTVYWLGASSERGSLQFYRADGYVPVRVSNPGVEALMMDYNRLGGWTGGPYCFTKLSAGHTFFVTNFPLARNYAGQIGSTMVYDLTTDEWHEETYESGGVVTQALPSCFASNIVPDSGKPFNFAGSSINAKIYSESPQALMDDGAVIFLTNITPHVSNDYRWVPHNSLILDATNVLRPSVQISNDGGRTFGSSMSFIKIEDGDSGTVWGIFSLGSSRDRVYKTRIAAGIADNARIANVWLDVGEGTLP